MLDDYEKNLVAFAKEIAHYLQKSGARADIAVDVSQDVLLKLLESHISLPKEKLRAWMYRVAVRRYIDLYRRDKKYLEILRQEFFNEEQLIAYEQEDYQALYDALDSLKPAYRLAIDLFYFQGFSTKEISQLLNWSLSKVKTNLKRGRDDLQTILEKEGYTHEDFNIF